MFKNKIVLWLSLSSLKVGENLTLSQCTEEDTQQFELNTDG